MKGYFVTGTDTNVGKTHVTAAIARLAHARGTRVFAFKPIETGCADQTVGPDQEALAQAAGGWQTGILRSLYRFAPAVAPLVAAQAADVVIDLERIRQIVEQQAVDLVLVEGAGGWRVPITATTDMSTLAAHLGFPVLVVARAGLGTINHTLLTVDAITRNRCKIAAVILSRMPTDDVGLARSNVAQIQARWSGTVILYEADDCVLQRFT